MQTIQRKESVNDKLISMKFKQHAIDSQNYLRD